MGEVGSGYIVESRWKVVVQDAHAYVLRVSGLWRAEPYTLLRV